MSVPDDGELKRLFKLFDDAFAHYKTYLSAAMGVTRYLSKLTSPTGEPIEQFRKALERLRIATPSARLMVDSLADRLDESAEALVDWSPIFAANLHEAMVLIWEDLVAQEWSPSDFEGDVDEVRSGRWQIMMRGPDRVRTEAELRRERASLRKVIRELRRHAHYVEDGLWMFEGGRIILKGGLAKLSGQKRNVMSYLIQRHGRMLLYEDFAADVWGTPEIDQRKTIQQAVLTLRQELKKLGLEDVAKRIRTETGGYLFE